MASYESREIFLGPKPDLGKEDSSVRKQIASVVQSAKEAVKEGLNPNTLMARAILVVVPAIGVPLAPLMHLTNSQLVVDLLGWFSLGFGMTAYGTRFFVLAIGFTTIASGIPVWLLGSPNVLHAGTSGILFGIFGFHMSILPFRRPLHWADVASFCIFDVGFGGIWWFEHYNSPGASPFLSVSGLFSGIAFAWVYFRIFSECLDVQESLPLLGSSLLYVEKATESAVDKAAYSGVQNIEKVSAAALAAANATVQDLAADYGKPNEPAMHENPYHHWNP